MKTSKQCDCCKCMIEFEKSDIHSEYRKAPITEYVILSANFNFIICPICKNIVELYKSDCELTDREK